MGEFSKGYTGLLFTILCIFKKLRCYQEHWPRAVVIKASWRYFTVNSGPQWVFLIAVPSCQYKHPSLPSSHWDRAFRLSEHKTAGRPFPETWIRTLKTGFLPRTHEPCGTASLATHLRNTATVPVLCSWDLVMWWASLGSSEVDGTVRHGLVSHSQLRC